MPQGSLAKPNGRWVHDHLLSLTLLALLSFLGSASSISNTSTNLIKRCSMVGRRSRSSAPSHEHLLGEHPGELQSEFLQLLSFVVLTTYLIHRHSHEIRDSSDEMAADIRAIKNKLEE